MNLPENLPSRRPATQQDIRQLNMNLITTDFSQHQSSNESLFLARSDWIQSLTFGSQLRITLKQLIVEQMMMKEIFLLLLMASLATILEASTLDKSKNKVGKQFLINGLVTRSTNGSLGVYEFLRPDCLKGSIRNSLNLTTLLPSMTASDLTGSCLRGHGKFHL